MSFNRMVVVALLVVAGIGGALACGPDFPWQLLDDRDQDRVRQGRSSTSPSRPRTWWMRPATVRAPSSAMTTNSPEAVASEREEVRSGAWRGLLAGAIDTDMARVETRRGTRGRRRRCRPRPRVPAFPSRSSPISPAPSNFAPTVSTRRWATSRRSIGCRRNQRQIRVVAAAYMRGRIQQRLGSMAAGASCLPGRASVRQAGAPDPMGLAVASLGEEARTDLVEAGLIEVPWPVPVADADEARFARLIADAVRLYADQAARGSKMALLSLNEVARRLIARGRTQTRRRRSVRAPPARGLCGLARARLRLG